MEPLNLQPFPVLHTDRLTLKSLTLNDDGAIFALRSDDSVNQFIGRKKAETLKEAQDFIANINKSVANNDSIYWAIRLKDTDTLVGTICFWNLEIDNALTEIGYELLPAYQGKGLMNEAIIAVIQFAFQIGFQTIMADSEAENAASISFLERHHFKLNALGIYELRNSGK